MTAKMPIEFVRCKPLIEQQLSQELSTISNGDGGGAILIQSMIENLSLAQYQEKIATSRGKERDVFSSLVNVSTEIKQMAVIALVKQIADADLVEATLRHARIVIGNIKLLEKIDHAEQDEYLQQLYSEAKHDVTRGAREAREWYRNQVGKMFD